HAQLVLGRPDIEGVVVDRALAEAPRTLLEARLLDELEHAAVAVALDLVLVVGAFGRDLLAVERLAQELVHRAGLTDARRRAAGAADRVPGGHVAAPVGLARALAGLPHDLVRDAAGMRELEPLGAEALGLVDRQAGVVEPVRPVADRLRRD